MEIQTPSVNLLKTKGNAFTDKFIKWALTIGRMVIILTETIALVAFLYRFILDRQLIDQKDIITQKAAQVDLYKKNEKDYRNLQDRLALIKRFDKQATDTVGLLTHIVELAPAGISFITISLGNNAFHIDASSQSVNAFTTFVNRLKKEPGVQTVSIDRIENKTLNATIVVGITVKLQPNSNQIVLLP
jgi:Tfp pilus assembly protein PilN